MRKYDDEKKSGSTTGSIRGRDDTGTWIFWKFFMTNTPWSNTWDTEKTNESKKEWMDTGNSIPHIDIDTTVEEFYSKLVLETYKTQLKKNIKDLDITLKKIYPDETDRWEAYKKIKETYENVQANIKENTSSGSIGGLNKKQMKIYDESLTYLIWLLDIRINSLGK